MPPRWNAWTHLQAVQLDFEKEPKQRQVRLIATVPRAGDQVRIGVSGVEIEGVIALVDGGLLRVKVKATPIKARPVKKVRRA